MIGGGQSQEKNANLGIILTRRVFEHTGPKNPPIHIGAERSVWKAAIVTLET